MSNTLWMGRRNLRARVAVEDFLEDLDRSRLTVLDLCRVFGAAQLGQSDYRLYSDRRLFVIDSLQNGASQKGI